MVQKKILYLITKSNLGGAQVYVRDLAIAFDAESFESVVALGGDGALKTELEEAGIRTIQIPSLQRDISIVKELCSFLDMYRILKIERPQILHVNSSKAGGLGAFAGRLTGVPNIIYTAHGWAFNEDRGFLSRFAVKFFHWLTILFSHKTIAVSKSVKSQMRWPLVQSKMTVLYNGKKPADYLSRDSARQAVTAIIPELANHPNDIWTISIGELHPIKRHDVAIESIGNLIKKDLDIRHVIIGEGELRDELEKMVKDRGLQEYIFFAGYQNDAARYLKGFDVFILPSRSEALCYVAIESLQAGLPVVGSNVGGIPEIVSNGASGILVERENVEALSVALETLTTDERKRVEYGKKALEESERFAFESMLEGTKDVYNTHLRSK